MLTAADYSTDFFREYELGSLRSAKRILPIAIELLEPSSMVDVGCGVGTWARAAMELGIIDVVGVDGDYIDRAALQIPADRFRAEDLGQPLSLERRFDLAVSMEVAEHLAPERATQFIGELTGLAPAVLFSAAIPHQDGHHHVNERWQSYWAELFRQFNFEPFDVIRPQVWRDAEVEPWYAQNVILYLSQDLATSTTLTASMPGELFDLVHPEMYAAKMTQPRLRFLLKALPAAVGRRLRQVGGSRAST
jgi:SAM-dependent methyltransferase